jgi:Fic-DOC domain mobile mystery protein B
MPVEAQVPRLVSDAITPEEQARLVPSLSTRAQLDEIEGLNVNAARIWAMRATVLGREDILTESFSRELHRRMFNGIWRGAGRYRTTARVPGWEPQRIAEGVRMFFDDAEGWAQFSTYPVHEIAVRLHHRLVSIHPWANGNGRHARLIADVIVAARGESPLTWGFRSDLREPGMLRLRYISSIKAADAGDVGPLMDFARG